VSRPGIHARHSLDRRGATKVHAKRVSKKQIGILASCGSASSVGDLQLEFQPDDVPRTTVAVPRGGGNTGSVQQNIQSGQGKLLARVSPAKFLD
jgi:hypothetical protein